MVLSAERKKELATKLNDLVDVPFLNEEQEQMIAEKLIDACMAPMAAFMPSDDEMRSMARSTDEAGMQQQVKESMVDKMNKKIDIPFASEAHEATIIGMAVDYLMAEKFDEIHRSLDLGTEECAAPEDDEGDTAEC